MSLPFYGRSTQTWRRVGSFLKSRDASRPTRDQRTWRWVCSHTHRIHSTFSLGKKTETHTSKFNVDDDLPGCLEAAAAAAHGDRKTQANFILWLFRSVVWRVEYEPMLFMESEMIALFRLRFGSSPPPRPPQPRKDTYCTLIGGGMYDRIVP